MDVSGLACEWDSNVGLRKSARFEKRINIKPATAKWCEPTRRNCTNNTEVLLPCLKRLRDTPALKLPYATPLQTELAVFYDRVGVPVDEKLVYTSSMEIKKMLSLVKRYASKRVATKDCKFLQNIYLFWDYQERCLVHGGRFPNTMLLV